MTGSPRRKELLGSQSLAVVMQPDKNGMPQTEKARRLSGGGDPQGRADGIPGACVADTPAPGGSSS